MITETKYKEVHAFFSNNDLNLRLAFRRTSLFLKPWTELILFLQYGMQTEKKMQCLESVWILNYLKNILY